jgi:alanine racemase
MGNNIFYRDTWVEVNLDDIRHNVQAFLNYLPKDTRMIAVVKANGYGHGAIEVAKTAIEYGVSYLAVAILDEAIELRKAGIKASIVVLGFVRAEDVMLAAENDITLTVFQREWLEKAKQYLKDAKTVKVHLKIDTGMARLGIRDENEAKIVLDEIKKNTNFKLEGLFTHFATADELGEQNLYYDLQVQRFKRMLQELNLLENQEILIHASNSAATLRDKENLFNAVRIGISMYGLAPSGDIKKSLPFPLKEAFSLHSKIIHVKKVNKGDAISYGATYVANEDEWIGTIPIGYADGWLRKLGNGTDVLVNGTRTQIVGRVCMDQLMIRLSEPVPLNTKVTLIGKQGNETISVDEVAERLETINYEVPCTISSRVPRVYKEAGTGK